MRMMNFLSEIFDDYCGGYVLGLVMKGVIGRRRKGWERELVIGSCWERSIDGLIWLGLREGRGGWSGLVKICCWRGLGLRCLRWGRGVCGGRVWCMRENCIWCFLFCLFWERIVVFGVCGGCGLGGIGGGSGRRIFWEGGCLLMCVGIIMKMCWWW